MVVVAKSVGYVLTVVMPATGIVTLQMTFMHLVDVQRIVGKAVPMTINAKSVVIIRMTVPVSVLW